jgi:hypothetical protein
MFRKTILALACFGLATPAMANPIASPALGQAVSLSGTLIQTIGIGSRICNLTMSGSVTSVGTATTPGVVTFNSGTLSGPGCQPTNIPIVLRTISTNQVSIDLLSITGGTVCPRSNLVLPYNNATGVVTMPSTTFSPCATMSGTLHITGLVIAP